MQIYIAEGTQPTGPFDLEAIKDGLRTGRYTPAQLAWYEGAPGWEPISLLPGLEAVQAPPPPPAAPVPPPVEYDPPPDDPPSYTSYAPAPEAAGRRHGARWWKVGVAALGIVALAGGLITLGRSLRPAGSSGGGSPTPGSAPTAGATRHFVTERSHYGGKLAEHYVKFSFDYPEAWSLLESSSDSYVELRRNLALPDGRNVPVESVVFSYAYCNPGYSLSKNLGQAGPTILAQAAAMMANQFPGSTTSPVQSGHFGKYGAEEQFGASQPGAGEPKIYWRMILVPQPNDSADGVFVNLTSSEPAGAKSADTLGDGGGLRTIRDSFRFEP